MAKCTGGFSACANEGRGGRKKRRPPMRRISFCIGTQDKLRRRHDSGKTDCACRATPRGFHILADGLRRPSGFRRYLGSIVSQNPATLKAVASSDSIQIAKFEF